MRRKKEMHKRILCSEVEFDDTFQSISSASPFAPRWVLARPVSAIGIEVP
jgi:hypothetical protein